MNLVRVRLIRTVLFCQAHQLRVVQLHTFSASQKPNYNYV